MEHNRYLSKLKQRLYPAPYSDEVSELPEGMLLLLSRRKKRIARYAFAVASWDDSADGRAFLRKCRQSVTTALNARWMFRGVGLYLVVIGNNADWRERLAEMPADRTGLHATIVQGVHFVHLPSGESATNRSAWGPITFGNVEMIAELVNTIPVV